MLAALKNILIGAVVGISALALVAMALYFSLTSPALHPAPAATLSPSPVLVELAATSMPTATQSPVPTPTITATATFTPIATLAELQYLSPTVTPSLTPTADVVQAALDQGALAFSGPLENAEQVNLYRTSLAYSEPSVADSRRLAVQINGVGYGDPTNICGPLAVAILRDAGLFPSDIVPHDFWLLNPLASTDERLLQRAFPPDQYIHAIVPTPINQVDWRATPLYPGDFIFIWHGSWGNFDHMLVVSRVDAAQRAYAVTNYGTPEGYMISEALLYDPADASAGLFHQWTRERDAILGSTGFGGYELWRRRSP